MAKPVFILCSEAISVDQETQALSIFNVLEKVQFKKLPKPKDDGSRVAVVETFKMRILSIWLREGADIGETFETESFVTIPPNNLTIGFPRQTFQFTSPLHRINLLLHGLLPFQVSGEMRVTSQIRKLGDEKWISQDY